MIRDLWGLIKRTVEFKAIGNAGFCVQICLMCCKTEEWTSLYYDLAEYQRMIEYEILLSIMWLPRSYQRLNAENHRIASHNVGTDNCSWIMFRTFFRILFFLYWTNSGEEPYIRCSWCFTSAAPWIALYWRPNSFEVKPRTHLNLTSGLILMFLICLFLLRMAFPAMSANSFKL